MLADEEKQVQATLPYAYQYGDRPLDGYTIERAVGRGGFGEVYYAVSDAGRQVALKTIQNYEQIELRGIKQCMNLKNPHLVSVFDVRFNDQQKPFVIMEYVSGPSLRDLIDASPGGLGEQKAAFFLREIAKGLSYLHECGIVHRDLKPGNIFYENGMVKIGDYGLSKAISSGVHSGQTITVGTVHYMAPEIGKGCYDSSIDIYALGIVLYEMLTGQVPFFGASAGEILMKHMANDVELDLVPESFRPVIEKALAKDPADRYHTVQEMIEAVFGSEHIRQSVSQFSPESLSMIAQRVAENVKAQPQASDQKEPVNAWSNVGQPASDAPRDRNQRSVRRSGADVNGQNTEVSLRMEVSRAADLDPVRPGQRRMLMLVTQAMIAMVTAMLAWEGRPQTAPTAVLLFALQVIAVTGMYQCRWRWCPRMEPSLLRNLVILMPGACLVMVISGITSMSGESLFLRATMLSMLPLIFFDWWKMTDPQRSKRVVLSHAIWAAVLGFLMCNLFNVPMAPLTMGLLAGITLAIQIASPFVPPELQGAFRRGESLRPHSVRSTKKSTVARNRRADDDLRAEFNVKFKRDGKPHHADVSQWKSTPLIWRRISAVFFVLCLGIGLILFGLLISGEIRGDEAAACAGACAGFLLAAGFALRRALQQHYRTVFQYAMLPVIVSGCALAMCISLSLILSGEVRGDEEALIALIMLIFPGLSLLSLLFLGPRLRSPETATAAQFDQSNQSVSPYTLGVAAFLCWIPPFGMQRFYVGKIGSGLLWLFTLGFLGIGQLIDFIRICSGHFTDSQGRRLAGASRHNASHPYDPLTEPRISPAAAAPPDPGASPPSPQSEPERVADTVKEKVSAQMASHAAPFPAGVQHRPAGPTFRPVSLLMGLVGSFLLLAAFLIGLLFATHVPSVVASAFVYSEPVRELNENFGPRWPDIANSMLALTTAAIGVAAVALILLSRRHHNATHLVRALFATALLMLSLGILDSAVPRKLNPVDVHNAGKALGQIAGQLYDQVDFGAIIFLIVALGGSSVLLAWPAGRKSTFPSATTASEPTEPENKGMPL